MLVIHPYSRAQCIANIPDPVRSPKSSTVKRVVLCDLQISSGNVYHPEQPHAQFRFLFPIVFGIDMASDRFEVQLLTVGLAGARPNKKTLGLQMFVTRLKMTFFFFLFTPVQTPVTLCSGELWSILVVRLAHPVDLRSRLRHVSSAPSFANSTGCSRVVTHPGTNPARWCLTSVI